MPHRHRQVHTGHAPAVAIGIALLAAGAGLLAGAWYFLARRAPVSGLEAPPEPVSDEEMPFDRPVVEDGVWVLEVESAARWRSEPAAAARLVARLRACREFVRDGRFRRTYGEADENTVRVRIVCAHAPTEDVLRTLRGAARGLGGMTVELEDPRGEVVALE